MFWLNRICMAIAALTACVYAIDTQTRPLLAAKLRMANTNMERLNLLPNDSDWTYDFTRSDKYTFQPGGVVNANAATFPATIGQGLTMAMLNLGPCSMLPPHLHPRGANFVVAVKGTTRTFMIGENGARTVVTTLGPGQMTVFPTASIHAMMNIGCEDAQLVSALNSDDTGTHNIANAFFSLPGDFTETLLGDETDIKNFTKTVPSVGTGSNWGPIACRAACRAKGKII